KLGEGGMGIVYKAEDTKLKRKVALKFLPREMTAVGAHGDAPRERFFREAQAAAALNHPNIVHIYEINEHEDQTYIAMEYVEGSTLKDKIASGPLPLADILEISTQICEGLQKAHEAGIVHRDIKPQNIIIDKEGRVKILDFGLAKLRVGANGYSPSITKIGTTMGTINYMSPEQSLGKEVDLRTDIWSMGVILYEMITGKLPFKGEYEQAVIYSIINEEPEPVLTLRSGIPAELEVRVKKALTKDPSKRYQHVYELIEDLKKIKTDSITEKYKAPKGKTKSAQKPMVLGIILIAAIIIAGFFIFKEKKEKPVSQIINKTEKISETKWKNSIAVLPFSDMSPKKDQEYFCDGIAEEILNKLTHIKGLKVIARTSSFQFKGKQADITEIGLKLKVSTVLEGSVRKAGETIRVTAQLINVNDHSHIWSDTFDRELKDILSIQDEIALAIVGHLRGRLLNEEKRTIGKRYTENIKAHEDFLKGRFRLNKLTIQDMKKSVDYFKQAIKKDPNFALAYCGLAHAYDNLSYSGEMSEVELWQRVETEARKALKIDSTLSEAHMILADAQFLFHWNWGEAESLFKRAIELNDGNSIAHNWYAQYLSAMGRHDEAIKEIKRAHELDPLSLAINLKIHMIYIHADQYDIAENVLTECTNLFPDHPFIHLVNGYHFMIKSNYTEAINQFNKIPISSIGPVQQFALARALAFSGNISKARRILNNLIRRSKHNYLSATHVAKVYISLGNKDQTYLWLDKALKERDSDLVYIKVEPTYDRIRTDPRFKALVKKMRFPE
ncbi:MAG: protein kinase, partial [Candidatus Aminicenantes bacterium]|nr:protein kinase [Candidatus Aminicenantes bacterium]